MWQPGTRDQKKIAIEVGRRRMGRQSHGKGRKVEQIAFFEEEENTAEAISPLASLPAMESRWNHLPVSSEQCASSPTDIRERYLEEYVPVTHKRRVLQIRAQGPGCLQGAVRVSICRLVLAGESSRRCPSMLQQCLEFVEDERMLSSQELSYEY